MAAAFLALPSLSSAARHMAHWAFDDTIPNSKNAVSRKYLTELLRIIRGNHQVNDNTGYGNIQP